MIFLLSEESSYWTKNSREVLFGPRTEIQFLINETVVAKSFKWKNKVLKTTNFFHFVFMRSKQIFIRYSDRSVSILRFLNRKFAKPSDCFCLLVLIDTKITYMNRATPVLTNLKHFKIYKQRSSIMVQWSVFKRKRMRIESELECPPPASLLLFNLKSSKISPIMVYVRGLLNF